MTERNTERSRVEQTGGSVEVKGKGNRTVMRSRVLAGGDPLVIPFGEGRGIASEAKQRNLGPTKGPGQKKRRGASTTKYL
jgi:hypothetical protein